MDAGLLFHAVDGGDVRVIDCGEERASRSNRARRSGFRLKRRWKDLDRHFAPEFQVACAIYLPHSASTQDANNLERTDTVARSQGHVTDLGTMVIAVIIEPRFCHTEFCGSTAAAERWTTACP